MARITKAQTYAIRWLNYQQKKIEDISTELNLTVNQVNSILEKYGTSETKPEIKTAQQPVSRVKTLLTSKTANSQSVTVMTQEASMAIQDDREKNPTRKNPDSYIYKPNS